MPDKYRPVDLGQVKTYPLSQRQNKVKAADFARPCSAGLSLRDFLDSLPHILAGEDFRQVVKAIVEAHRTGRPVIWAMGAHVIKCGLSPLVIELMRRRVIRAVALNGAGGIHDLEVALIGQTSEDVADGLRDGTFGMAEETGRLLNEATRQAAAQELGLGQALGRQIVALGKGAPFSQHSILARGVEGGIPVTVHVALGTDIVHMHPTADGAATGQATFTDFRLLAALVADLEGGVYLNVGSAVLLPEVFLKALTVARNLNHGRPTAFTAVNMDVQRHYRPAQNVVGRPVGEGGKGYTLIGHHELMIPLLVQAIIEELGDSNRQRGDNAR